MASLYKDDIDLENGNDKKHPINSHKQIAYLDGLRGVAALLVYLSHNIVWWYGPDSIIEHGFGYHGEYMLATFPFIRTVFTGGAAAVAVFFVMSGYVLSTTPLSLLDAGDKQKIRTYLLTATVRRPFRLFLPVAAVSLIFAMCMHLPFGLAPKLSWPTPEQSVAAELWKWVHEFGWVMNIFAKHGTFEHWFPYDPPVWTMAAEMKGSLVVYASFFILTMLKWTSARYSPAFAALGSTLLVAGHWEIAAFMYGMVLATSQKEGSNQSTGSTRSPKTLINYMIFMLSWYILGQPHGKREIEISLDTPGWYYLTKVTPPAYADKEFWRFWNVIGATFLIDAVRNILYIQHLLQKPAIRYLGKISFCFYLTHILILFTISDRVARLLGVIRHDFTTPYDRALQVPDLGPTGFSTGFLLWQAVVLPINLFVAAIATKFIDQPSIKLSKWLAI